MLFRATAESSTWGYTIISNSDGLKWVFDSLDEFVADVQFSVWAADCSDGRTADILLGLIVAKNDC